MKAHAGGFLDLEPRFSDPESAAVVILPVPYEAGVSYGRGAAQGPAAVISASSEVELYDEVLDREPYRMGIATAEPPEGLQGAEDMNKAVYSAALSIASARQLPVGLGGDHSISPAIFHALHHSYGAASVIQLDAHSDLRKTYDGTPYSHACTMSRIRRLTKDTLQIGIRSLCLEEARLVKSERVPLCTMDAFRTGSFDLQGAISALPDPVYLTLDVDVLDWSVVWSTGTPEPGGFVWHEIIELLQLIFSKRMVIGFDVVELSCGPEDINSAFAVARLVYKMLGFWLNSLVQGGVTGWPLRPSGPLIRMEKAAPYRG